MAARPRRAERCKALRLACWNADVVRGRKLELEHFLSQHSVDICLLSETFLKPDQAFRLTNFVCHRLSPRLADHEEPRSESRGNPPAEVGDPSTQRVEERPVEYYAQIPRSRRPIAVEDEIGRAHV
jgi:hypothetical protein